QPRRRLRAQDQRLAREHPPGSAPRLRRAGGAAGDLRAGHRPDRDHPPLVRRPPLTAGPGRGVPLCGPRMGRAVVHRDPDSSGGTGAASRKEALDMKQPALGITATAVVVAISWVVILLLGADLFMGWASYALMGAIPFAILV